VHRIPRRQADNDDLRSVMGSKQRKQIHGRLAQRARSTNALGYGRLKTDQDIKKAAGTQQRFANVSPDKAWALLDLHRHSAVLARTNVPLCRRLQCDEVSATSNKQLWCIRSDSGISDNHDLGLCSCVFTPGFE